MSREMKIVVALLWTLVVLVVAGAFVYSSLKARTYNGSEVAFSTAEGWYMDVNTVDPIHIEAADSVYFRIVQDKTHMYGIPETPPLDYVSDEYFFLDAQLQEGEWKVADGMSIDIKLVGEEVFSVIQFPVDWKITEHIFLGALFGFMAWLIGLLIGTVISGD